MEQFGRIRSDDRVVNEVQSNTERVLIDFTDRSFNDHVFIEGIELKAANTAKIEHGLNRFVRGWVVARQSAPGFIYENIPVLTPDDTDRFLYLRTTATSVTVSLLVF